ncbi:MAG: carbon starvation CstA family protein [Pseudohongiella sp.]|nr:carbon starvation CstA family protein [Pseudohongiella sp.]MDO9520643.1 carbon starvation CstA family protein [Pseudohongiella sp.]MDP2127913.1 carbon starvation CstA family protein [Pseudohongiella sp.]
MREKMFWGAVALLGAACLGVLALNRGETISALWLVTAALCVYTIAYRFYSRFIAEKVLVLEPLRPTPAHTKSDGLDFVPTHKWVLFGHHFAAIAGAGPLVGPVLAAQMGYLPGTLWILAGVVFAGAVQDMIIMFLSTRRGGASLGDMIRKEMGPVAGFIGLIGILAILIILLAVLGMIVVKALVGSPWGVFTLAMTIPIALFMGIYLRYIRPGKVGEISVVGFALLIFALIYGQTVAVHPTWGPIFNLDGKALTLWLMGYGFVASVLPVWLLLAPRDYLSTFLKIGTIAGLAVGILIVNPPLIMPSFTPFIDGTGPVFSGALFPFLFITIACGAVSGFHALVSSGTTPKMIDNESHIRPIGYGAMLTESFVAIMALIAACVLEPGVYFALNSGPGVIGTTVQSAAETISQWGFVVTPEMLDQLASDMGESTILSRTGGAPTFAVGMAHILSQAMGGTTMMAFWYHFAILFEALFILTTVDAGTRVCRFLMQDLMGMAVPMMKDTNNHVASLLATAIVVSGWGYFLYQGVSDPFGGINTLWALFGISNQMLAGIALILATVALVRLGRGRLALVPAVPAVWVLLITMFAGWQKLFSDIPAIGFLAHARVFTDAIERGDVLAPATTIAQMNAVVFNDRIDAFMTGFFMVVVIVMAVLAVVAIRKALNGPQVSEEKLLAEYVA